MKNEYMDIALDEARKAYLMNEVPVGAVIVKNNEVIAKAHNIKLETNNIMNHAEIIAILEASRKLNDWRLNDCEIYVTLEPCPMCASAIQQSRIKKIYIGTPSNILSNRDIIEKIFNSSDAYHLVQYEYLNDNECSNILTQFFTNKR